jgi:pilus assembly protein CpaB
MARLQRLDRRTLIILIGAVVVALIASILFAAFSRPPGPPPVATTRTVVVANQDIPANTMLTAAMLSAQLRPIAGMAPDAVNASQANEVIGATTLGPIAADSPVTLSRVGHPSQLGLSATLRVGERAIAIPIDRVKAVDGLIEPGDRVDVIAIVPLRGTEGPIANTILRDIKVLAVGSTIAAPAANASPMPGADGAATATLDVTPQQADLLAVADANSQLRLALRSPNEPANSQPVQPVSFQPPPMPVTVPAAAAAPPPPAPSATSAPKRKGGGVEIINGDTVVSGT